MLNCDSCGCCTCPSGYRDLSLNKNTVESNTNAVCLCRSLPEGDEPHLSRISHDGSRILQPSQNPHSASICVPLDHVFPIGATSSHFRSSNKSFYHAATELHGEDGSQAGPSIDCTTTATTLGTSCASVCDVEARFGYGYGNCGCCCKG